MEDLNTELRRVAVGCSFPAAVFDASLCLRAANPAFCAALRLSETQILGRGVEELGQGQWDFSLLRGGLDRLLSDSGADAAGGVVAEFQIEPMLLGVGLPLLWLRAQRLAGSPPRLLLGVRQPAAPARVPAAPAPTVDAVAAAPAPATGPVDETLTRENYLLQLLMEAVPDTIFIKDRESRFVQANRALAKKLGLAGVHEAIGKTDRDFFSPEMAARFRAREEAILTTGEPVVNQEQREVWEDGQVTWALLTQLPLRDKQGKIVGTFGITRDVTDRHRAEEALRLSELRYRALFERSLCGVFRSSVAGRLLDCNDAFAHMFGYPDREEALRQPATSFHHRPEDRLEFLAALRRQGVLTNNELRVRRRDGSEMWVLQNSSLSRDDAGEEIVEGTLIDITERRQFEDRLRQANKMEAVARLAGGVAHDFNNLLTIISGQCEMLLLPSDDAARRRERVEAIRRAGDRAAGLTRQLLAFSRQLPVSFQAVDLNACVRRGIAAIRQLAGAEVDVGLALGAELGNVRADPGEIEQILLSLAANAREAMPRGGRISIATRNAELRVHDERGHLVPGRYIVLSVADTGVGIPLELQSRIFEPFFTTKGVGQGSGLGLASVYGMVKLSGGEVRVRSAPGEGATFEIWLPALPAAGTDGAGLTEPDRSIARTILLVEDEAGVRATVREALEIGGYHVLEAAFWQQAMDHCREFPGPIHLLLTDAALPEQSGWKLAEEIRSLRPESKLLLMSGQAERVIAAQTASGLGANLLLKPFTPDTVLRRVREVLGNS